jgi:hypothetical protein
LSRQKEAFFRGYGQIRLLFTLSLIHDLSEGSVLVGPLGSRLWRGTEQERSATALSVISVLGICFSVAVFPFLRKITRKLRVLIHKIPVFFN